MTTEDNILIENYLKGLLSIEERQLFEERLKTDVNFRHEYTLEKQLNAYLNDEDWNILSKDNEQALKYKKALKGERLSQLKESLSTINSEINSKPKQKNRLVYYLAAASVVVFLGIQLFFNQGVSNQELYYANVELNKLPSFVTRETSSEIQLKLMKGQQQFKKGNYKEALQIFEDNLESQKNNSLVYIYTGLAQIELGLYNESEITFNNLSKNKNQDAHITHWYKALLYLKQEKNDKAQKQLDIIVQNPNSLYYNKALELTQKIKK